jgi:putative Mg2+ transporter-C (MgtC) family protein
VLTFHGFDPHILGYGPGIHPDALLDMFARLILASLLGALVGFERETHGRPAGLRTHMLVCMGSTIFTIVSTSFVGSTPDPSRIASQIVSGIGFLGAGTIIRQGSIVRGLTTAASLWTIAAIGMAIGVSWNLAVFGVIASVVVFITLSVMSTMEHRLISNRRFRELAVIMKDVEQQVAEVLRAITMLDVEVLSLRKEDTGEIGTRLMKFRLRLPGSLRHDAVTEALSGIPSVISLDWD